MGRHTSHCEHRRGYESSARAARARCGRTNTTMVNDINEQINRRLSYYDFDQFSKLAKEKNLF